MREILFKAKGLKNDEWAEGHYYPQLYYRPAYEEIWCHIIKPIGSRSYETIHVNPDTLCQYTGKTDINKNKIWENDIVKEGCNGLIAKVIWDEELATYRLEGLGPDYTIKDASIEWEVIGNIFDNPELLQYNERDER